MTDPLIASALKALTVADVDRLEAEIVKRVGGQWPRNLGDLETNWSAVASPVDPRTVIFERVTNMWDAIIEAEAKRRRDFSCASPAEAARKFFGVPHEGPRGLDGAARRRLASMSTLTFLDSDDPKRRPSIAARDHGLGLMPKEMPETILSLQRSNKLGKPYLHGVFGKGGSVACMFSRATIIVTRKQPHLLDGAEDRVALAVVREADSPDVRLPFFRYLTDADGLPFSVPAEQCEFEPGTLVVHIGYQAERMGETNWTWEDSIYAFAETLLFRPTLPYLLDDARSEPYRRRPAGRKGTMLMGLGQRLEATGTAQGLIESTKGQARLSIPEVGEVGLRWWLFDEEDKRRKRSARGYVALFTTGGQVHHTWDTQRFKTLVDGRQRVARRIVVEIDADSVEQKKRVRIFSSFRDAILKSPEATALERAVADWLANDPDLEEAEARFTREALRASDQEISTTLRDRLNRAIRSRASGLGGRQLGPAPRPRPPAPRPADELYAEPTEFVGPESLEALAGQRKVIYMKCNAVDGFVPARGEVEVAVGSGGALSYGVGDLRRGRLQLSLSIPDDLALGSYPVDVRLSWMRTAGGTATLSWPVALDVVPQLHLVKPPAGGHGKKPTTRSEFAFLWSKHEDEEGWDEQTAGELKHIRGTDLALAHPKTYGDLKDVEETVPTILLNDHFRDYHSYLNSSARSVENLNIRRDRYAIAVGTAVANLYLIEEKLRKAHLEWEQEANGRDEPERPMTDTQLKRALAEHARGVLTLLPEFDQILGDVDREETLAAV